MSIRSGKSRSPNRAKINHSIRRLRSKAPSALLTEVVEIAPIHTNERSREDLITQWQNMESMPSHILEDITAHNVLFDYGHSLAHVNNDILLAKPDYSANQGYNNCALLYLMLVSPISEHRN